MCLVSEFIVHFADDLELVLDVPGQLVTCIRESKAFSGLRKSFFKEILFSQNTWLVHWEVLENR